jgi:hypothetical protein
MDHYINKFITNLPDSVIKSLKGSHIDLILEGGSFNGSYQVGCLLYLKELETKGYLVINRISGASIGSLMAFLYLTNNLDLTDDLYKLFYNNLKENYNLSVIKELKKILIEKERMPDKLLDLVNKKLYISYYNLDKSKKIIKKTYKNIDDIFEALIKSCYLPFVIDGNLIYKKKYHDGLTPFIFTKELNKRILYLDIMEIDKIFYFYSVKNEFCNDNRVLTGLVDINNFFIKGHATSMCSFIDQWGIYHHIKFLIKQMCEKIIIINVYIFIYLNKNIYPSLSSSTFYTLFEKTIYEIYKMLIQSYCI